jgi:hypothetical protein
MNLFLSKPDPDEFGLAGIFSQWFLQLSEK